MTAERWVQIKEIFQAALEKPMSGRDAFLAQACRGDSGLRQEVESLLVAQDSSSLGSPAGELLNHIADVELELGQNLAQYRVEAKLGEGGMGAVYRAYDIRLRREVALKVLAPEHFADPESKQRLLWEARAASALNHPNIVTVHEIGFEKGADFIAMELVKGKSLAELIPAKGLPLKKALDYAVQIAGGLAKAHAAGIIHRDLKPGNIMVTPDGAVKLLDFGLAQRVRRAESDTSSLTMEGQIAGTPAYMSPEQAEGKKTDGRSDVFAFGAVLYEMVTGRRAFHRDSRLSTLLAILKDEPKPASELVPDIPRDLEKIIGRCLRKDLEWRFQNMADVRVALYELREEYGSGILAHTVPPPARRRSRSVPIWITATLVLVVGASGVWLVLRKFAPREPTIRLQVTLPNKLVWGVDDIPVVSPDGRRIVFAGSGADGVRRLWLRSLDSNTAQPLPGTENSRSPFWSPDSRFVAFGTREKDRTELKRIDWTGGPPVKVCNTRVGVLGGTWNQDGVILFCQWNGPTSTTGWTLYRVPATGGEPRPVLPVDKVWPQTYSPQFLPDGRHFVYCSQKGPPGAENGAIFLGSLDSKETRMLIPGASNVAFAPPGYLVYGRHETLLGQPFDAGKLQIIGDPVTVAEQVERHVDDTVSLFSVSDNGVLVYRNATSRNLQISWYSRDGRSLGSIGEPGRYEDINLSADERHLAVERRDPQTATFHIWNMDVSNGNLVPLALRAPNAQFPVWSPDGRELVFSSDRNGDYNHDLYRRPVDGGDEELLVPSDESNDTFKIACQWLRNGSILFQAHFSSFYLLPLSGERKPMLLLKIENTLSAPHVSPDERWVAYQSMESGRWEVYVAAFPTFLQKQRISNNGGHKPLWRKDGKELFYLGLDGKLMSAGMRSGATLETGAPKDLFQAPRVEMAWTWGQYAVTGNGQRFIFLKPVEESSKSFNVVLNWTAGLKK